nr:hypothetical protein [Candidatus Freyarchaeota archaeon]
MSRVALLTGTIGGIVGTITTALAVIWGFITNTFLGELSSYMSKLNWYLTSVFRPDLFYGFILPYPIPYFPSASTFAVTSFILVLLLIVTGLLTGIGFYGTYKIGGGAMGIVALIFSIIGITLGALLILMGNLTIAYMSAYVWGGETGYIPALPVPIPNLYLIWISFLVIGITFIILGSASIKVGEMTAMPSASKAAGILSIIGSIAFILDGLIGIWAHNIILAIIGFGLIFAAFILWAVVFYSSRNM